MGSAARRSEPEWDVGHTWSPPTLSFGFARVCAGMVSAMFRMINPVQTYDWGSATAFSELFGWAAPGTPQAEVWMGAHPKAPSQVVTGAKEPVRLDDHLNQHPEQLGSGGPGQRLPFLLKILAVATPLSIQAHPSRDQAAAGFAAEEAAGIDLDAEHRNYVDGNHKPELVVALTDFTALCGFRDPQQTLADLSAVRTVIARQVDSAGAEMITAVQALSAAVGLSDFRAALQAALQDHRESLSRAAGLLAEADLRSAESELSSKTVDTIDRITGHFPADPGLFVALMLNRVDLSPGAALFLPSGSLHAYLGGVGVEVMANSDNVLRGGLTAKHVDVAELVRIASTEVLSLPLLEPDSNGVHHTYRPPAEEFLLYRIEFPPTGLSHQVSEPEPVVAVCTSGSVTAGSSTLAAGDSVFIPAGESAEFSATDAQLFIATVPGAPAQKVASR